MRQGSSRDHENDPPKDPDLQRWFQVLGKPPVAQEPPGARLRILARIEQHRKRRWGLSWLTDFATPALATGLAAGLLVSLGLNLWWGTHFFSSDRQDTQSVVAIRTERFDGTTPLPTYRFQMRMKPSEELGTRVAERLPKAATAPVVGFTPQAQRTTFFRIGRLYADALAALHSRAVETARQHLTWLVQALTSVQAPARLSQYLSMIQVQVQTQPNQIDQWRLWLAGFEPLYHDAYATATPSSARILFELGAWSENLYLAAATGEAKVVQQQGRAIQGIRQTLRTLNLPPKALELLAQLQDFIDKPNLSPSDLTAIRSQVQTLQDLLSE
ncbi:MAG: hypothetical protein OEU26_27525 [Candidatus Tectomicrobia bacterium]|nr:hypothetical protein [Candidatus Tectomicrobia bacterium]